MKNTKMEEDDENGEFPHAVKLRDYIFCIYRGSNLNESIDSRSNCLCFIDQYRLALGRK